MRGRGEGWVEVEEGTQVNGNGKIYNINMLQEQQKPKQNNKKAKTNEVQKMAVANH